MIQICWNLWHFEIIVLRDNLGKLLIDIRLFLLLLLTYYHLIYIYIIFNTVDSSWIIIKILNVLLIYNWFIIRQIMYLWLWETVYTFLCYQNLSYNLKIEISSAAPFWVIELKKGSIPCLSSEVNKFLIHCKAVVNLNISHILQLWHCFREKKIYVA